MLEMLQPFLPVLGLIAGILFLVWFLGGRKHIGRRPVDPDSPSIGERGGGTW